MQMESKMSETKQQAAVVDVKRVKTGIMILSYPFFIKPQIERDDDGKPKVGGRLTYSGTFIGFDKTPAETLTALKTAAFAAAKEEWGDKAEAMIKEGALRWPFRKEVATKGYDKVGGLWFISARSQKRPGLVDRIAAPGSSKPRNIESDAEIEKFFYPGAHVRAVVRAFAYKNKGKGVSFSLENVQFLGNGERLDNRVAAEDDFEAQDMSAAPAADIDSIM